MLQNGNTTKQEVLLVEKEKLKKHSKKIIIALFIFALIISASFDLWGKNFLPTSQEETKTTFSEKIRNKRIDSIKPIIKKSTPCIYDEEDIEKAADLIKTEFKNKDFFVSLYRISFNEDESEKQVGLYAKSINKNTSDVMIFYCDFFVLKDFAAYSKGIYNNWSVILVKENGNWEIYDQGFG